MNAPRHFLKKDFLLLTASLDVLFSIVYLAIYRPFSSSSAFWISLTDEKAGVYTMLFFVSGMAWLLLTKYILNLYDRRHDVTLRGLAIVLGADILGVSVLYMFFTFLAGKAGAVPQAELLLRTLVCVFLILVIPFALCVLYAFIQDRNEEIALLKLNSAPKEEKKGDTLLNLADYSGAVKISAMPDEICYLESQDNYVCIHFLVDGQMNSYLLRNTTAGLEDAFRGTLLMRCHRSFIINVAHVKLIKHEKGRALVVMDDAVGTVIPVSKSYYKDVMDVLVQYRAS
ncbi:MAG: LytTR family transcriptional regulator [Bacteroidales bacterium]|nr:LytTR family transcriptional regulator [Bacteroidales bacterium]